VQLRMAPLEMELVATLQCLSSTNRKLPTHQPLSYPIGRGLNGEPNL
jgi:hypothetical protein